MGLFKSKEEKSREEKLLLSRAAAAMKQQIERLESSRQRYIDAAVRARAEGSGQQYELAKYGLNIASAQKTTVEQMLLGLEMTAQAKDASEAGASFASGMNMLTGEIIKLSSGMDFDKVIGSLTGAFASSEVSAERMDETMQSAESGFSSLGAERGDEAEQLINQRLKEEETEEAADEQLSERIKKLKKNL